MHIAEMCFENPSPGGEWVRLVKELEDNPICDHVEARGR